MLKKIALFLSIMLLLNACGGGSSNTTNSPTVTDISNKTGVFLDSNVDGACYETSSGYKGKTNSKGEYKYKSGDTVKFCIGDLDLGEVKASALTTILEFKNSAQVATFLQSIDEDGNPNNGIKISENDAIKLRNTSFTIEEADSESSAFREKFKNVMGYSLEVEKETGSRHAVNALKTTILERYKPELLSFLNEEITFQSTDGYDKRTQQIYGSNPAEHIKSYEARLRLYFYSRYARDFLSSEYDLYVDAIKRGKITQQNIEEKAEKITSTVVSTYNLLGLSKATFDNVKELNKMKSFLNNSGVVDHAHFDNELMKFAADKLGKDVGIKILLDVGLDDWIGSSTGMLQVSGRLLKDCIPLGRPTAVDLIACQARVAGEAGVQLSGLFGAFNELGYKRKRNAALVAERFLSLHYLFNGDGKALGNAFYNILHTEEGLTTEVAFFDQDDSFSLGVALDAIAEEELGEGESDFIHNSILYDFDQAKEYIKQYQSVVNSLTDTFVDEFDVKSLDHNYIATSLKLEKSLFTEEHHVCLDLENHTGFDLNHLKGNLSYQIDDGTEVVSEIFTIDQLSKFDGKKVMCGDYFSTSAKDLLLKHGVIQVKYDLEYRPSRKGAGKKTQSGVKFFEISKKSVTEDLAKPIIILKYPKIVSPGERVKLSSQTKTPINNDTFNYTWSYIENTSSNEEVIFEQPHQHSSYITIPALPAGKNRMRLDFKLTVQSVGNSRSSEKKFVVMVDNLPLKAPEGLVIKLDNQTGFLEVDWSQASGAVSYDLEWSDNEELDSWEKIYYIETTAKSFKPTTLDKTIFVRVRSENSGGAKSEFSSTITFNPNIPLDTTPPVITITGTNPVTIQIGDVYVDKGATAIDEVDGVVAVNRSGSVNRDVADTYTITYTAKDAANNKATATRTVIVQALAPTPEITSILFSNQTIEVGNTLVTNVRTNIDVAKAQVRYSSGGSWKDMNPRVFGWSHPRIFESAGTKTIEVRILDENNVVLDESSKTISATIGVLTIYAGNDKTIQEGQNVILDPPVVTGGTGVSRIVWQLNEVNAPCDVFELTTCTVSGLTAGTYTIYVTVTSDDGQTAQDEVNVTVNPTTIENQLPTANAGLDQTITSGDSLTFQGISSDVDGTIVSANWTYIFVGGAQTFIIPESQADNEGVYTIGPVVDVGEYVFTFTVKDNSGAVVFDEMVVNVVNSVSNKYTKISSTGATLPDSASQWSCVKDNETGLMWEGKTNDNGLHHYYNYFFWYNTDSNTNGGDAGSNLGNKGTETFVSEVNSVGYCGSTDWRMPKVDELLSLVDLNFAPIRINQDYFLNSDEAQNYWSSEASNLDSHSAFSVSFWYSSVGGEYGAFKTNGSRVRLVRN